MPPRRNGVGDGVGSDEGVTVGSDVGARDGKGDGDGVGGYDGYGVGRAVGTGLGECVGSGVGAELRGVVGVVSMTLQWPRAHVRVKPRNAKALEKTKHLKTQAHVQQRGAWSLGRRGLQKSGGKIQFT